MHRIAVLTSGGEGPGANACIRAVTRTALDMGLEVLGVKRGFQGLMEHEVISLDSRSVGHGIIGTDGTMLGSSRSPRFRTPQGQREAIRTLNEEGVDGVIVIGGNGSVAGARVLCDHGAKVVAVPCTIDNDVYGTDTCIGVDTTLNTVVEAIDRIKDTASAHNRAFLIETMGRNSGYLALIAGISGGAEMVCIPEVPFELKDVADTLIQAYLQGKSHCIIVVAEGARYNAKAIADYLESQPEETAFEVRMTILGYIQRGGSPTAFDRLLATRLGAVAVKMLTDGQSGVMAALQGNHIGAVPLDKVVANTKQLDLDLYRLAEVLVD